MARGWVQLFNHDEIRAVKESGLPCDGMVDSHRLWVPRWLSDSIKVFKENGGFADLTLLEWLKKVNNK